MAVENRGEAQEFVKHHERLVVTLFVSLFGAVVFWEGTRQEGDSAVYPLVVGAAIIILSFFFYSRNTAQIAIFDG